MTDTEMTTADGVARRIADAVAGGYDGPLPGPDIAAAINQGWRNGLLELAVWCDQKAGNETGPGPNVLRAVASHARERAR